MMGSPPMYMRLDEYHTEQHRSDLKKIRSVLMDCTIASAEVNDGDLRLNYVDGNIDVIQREEFISKGDD